MIFKPAIYKSKPYFIALFGFFLGLSVLLGVLIPLIASGATILSDPYTFDDLEIGALVGQDEWLTHNDDYWVVTDDGCYSGKCIKPISANSDDYKIGQSLTDGRITFLYYTPDTCGKTSFLTLESQDPYTIGPGVGLDLDDNTRCMWCAGSGCAVDIESWGDHKNEWYVVEIEWRSSDHKARYRVSPVENYSEDWDTDWINSYWYGNWTFLDSIRLGSQGSTQIRIDEITENRISPDFEINFSTPPMEGPRQTYTSSFTATGTWSGFPTDTFDTLEVEWYDWNTERVITDYVAVETGSGNFYFNINEGEFWQSDFWVGYGHATKITCDDYGSCIKTKLDPENSGATFPFELAGNFGTSTEPEMDIEEFEFIPTWDTFDDFYASNSDKWTTSTNIGIVLDNSIGAITGWLYNLSSQLKVLDVGKETAGQSIGQAIQNARGYLATINNFFSGFPLAEIFSIYIIVFLIILILRLIKFIRGLLPF